MTCPIRFFRSGGEEATLAAAGSVMAPNTDNGLLGNPEEYNKFALDDHGTLRSMPWGGKGPQGTGSNGYLPIWNLGSYSQCKETEVWPERKLGMVGQYFRAVDMGVWGTNEHEGPCGSEVMAVSPPVPSSAGPVATTSVVLLRVSTVFEADNASTTRNTTYVRLVTDVNGTTLLHTDELGTDGAAFYTALLAQWSRWTPFVAGGAVPTIPVADQRYSDTAAALLTMYMNLDQGTAASTHGGLAIAHSFLSYTPPRIRAGALLSTHGCRILISACNPMLTTSRLQALSRSTVRVSSGTR